MGEIESVWWAGGRKVSRERFVNEAFVCGVLVRWSGVRWWMMSWVKRSRSDQKEFNVNKSSCHVVRDPANSHDERGGKRRGGVLADIRSFLTFLLLFYCGRSRVFSQIASPFASFGRSRNRLRPIGIFIRRPHRIFELLNY